MSDDRALLLVYNADSGLFNTVADIGHKIFSPQTYACDLCAITHGTFKMRGAWKEFAEGLNIPTEYLHRDEFYARWPKVEEEWPAVFMREGETLKLCLSRAEITELDTVDDLFVAIRNSCLD